VSVGFCVCVCKEEEESDCGCTYLIPKARSRIEFQEASSCVAVSFDLLHNFRDDEGFLGLVGFRVFFEARSHHAAEGSIATVVEVFHAAANHNVILTWCKALG